MIRMKEERVYETKVRLNHAIGAFRRHGWKIGAIKETKTKGCTTYQLGVSRPWSYILVALRGYMALQAKKMMLAKKWGKFSKAA